MTQKHSITTKHSRKIRSSDLTRGEKLLIDRKRHNLTQIYVAVNMGIPPGVYRTMEQDYEGVSVPYTSVGKLAPRESYMIMRRREGLSRAKLAELIGVSGEWIRQMETGQYSDLSRLSQFWGV